MMHKFFLAALALLLSSGCSHAKDSIPAPDKLAPVKEVVPLPRRAATATSDTPDNIIFPDDAGVINVKAEPYNAKGDGVTDDSAAIAAAFERTGLIYFPDGTYLVSRSFIPPKRRGKSPSRRILQGQSTAGAIIKLKDNTPEFGDAAKPLAIFTISYSPEQAFRNGVRNLTIDTGKGNAGAVGLKFYASNQGGIHHVNIRSGDGAGAVGLDLDYSGGNGPLLVRDVSVDGFDTGIDAGGGHLCTLENIRVTNQKKVGLYAQSYAFVRGFESVQTGDVAAVVTRQKALVTLIDANCKGAGDFAVDVESAGMLIRDLQTTGYKSAIKNRKNRVDGGALKLWTLGETQSLFPVKEVLALPVKATPEVPFDDPKTWANVMDFGPADKEVMWGTKKRKMFDITDALQKAIDSGATTVYLPKRAAPKPDAEYHILGTVFVRGKVRRIIGMEADLLESPGAVDDNNGAAFDAQVGKDIPSKIVIENGDAPVVVIERLNAIYGELVIENRSPRTLVMSSMLLVGAAAMPGAGDLFLEDIAMAYLDINGQNVWARQLNMERSYGATETNPRPNVRQNGGSLWIHGLKTEQNRGKVVVKNGKLQVSAFILANRGSNPQPMFELTDSDAAISVAEAVLRDAPYGIIVRETRDGETKDYTHEMAPKFGKGAMVSLFAADGLK